MSEVTSQNNKVYSHIRNSITEFQPIQAAYLTWYPATLKQRLKKSPEMSRIPAGFKVPTGMLPANLREHRQGGLRAPHTQQPACMCTRAQWRHVHDKRACTHCARLRPCGTLLPHGKRCPTRERIPVHLWAELQLIWASPKFNGYSRPNIPPYTAGPMNQSPKPEGP